MDIQQIVFWILIGALVGSVMLYFFKKRLRRFFLKRRSLQAHRAEDRAEKLLQQKGYFILGRQVRKPVVMFINQEKHESYIQVDYLVSDGEKIYVCEVKTGKQANMKLPTVRRQLFEYQNVFQSDGILFIDMNTCDIIEISFNDVKTIQLPLKSFFWGLVIGVLIMAFLFSYY